MIFPKQSNRSHASSLRTRVTTLAAGILLLSGGIASARTPAQEPALSSGQTDTVVAKVGSTSITADEFAEEMARRGGGRLGQYSSLDQRSALLDELIRERLLVAEAERLGLDQSEQVQAALRRLLIASVTRERLQPLLDQVTVSGEEVRRAFDQNQNLYRTPLRIRGAIIEFEKPRTDTQEAIEAFRTKVASVHEEAKELPASQSGFGDLARQHSTDQATRYTGGMLPWLYQRQQYKWGPEVVAALFALDGIGEVGPIVETEDKVYLVRLTDRDEPRQLGFDRYRAGIRNQLLQAKRADLQRQFFAQLEGQLSVERDLDALLQVPTPPATQPPTKALPPSPTQRSADSPPLTEEFEGDRR